MLEFTNIYPMDAVYDTPEDVPEDVRTQAVFLYLHTCHNLPDLHQTLHAADATNMPCHPLNLNARQVQKAQLGIKNATSCLQPQDATPKISHI